jgi:hypothetical protein
MSWPYRSYAELQILYRRGEYGSRTNQNEFGSVLKGR